MKIFYPIVIFLVLLIPLFLSGCYTQLGVKDDLENESFYSSSDQQTTGGYGSADEYYNTEGYSLGYRQRLEFSYYYPPIFPSDQFEYAYSTPWSGDYTYSPYPYYGGGSTYSYGSHNVHSPFMPYGPAYTRYAPLYSSPAPQVQGGSSLPQGEGGQGTRDFGTTRSVVPTGGGVSNLPVGASLGGSPRIVTPNNGSQNSSETPRNVGVQRGLSQPPAGGSSGIQGSGTRGGSIRGGNSGRPAEHTPNIKTPTQQNDTVRIAPAQSILPKNNTPLQTPPNPPNNTTNSGGKRPGASRGDRP